MVPHVAEPFASGKAGESIVIADLSITDASGNDVAVNSGFSQWKPTLVLRQRRSPYLACIQLRLTHAGGDGLLGFGRCSSALREHFVQGFLHSSGQTQLAHFFAVCVSDERARIGNVWVFNRYSVATVVGIDTTSHCTGCNLTESAPTGARSVN